MDGYHPTLWRTCRTLANPKRLLCLRTVFLSPSITVGACARSTGLAEWHVSEFLRALQARGLIQARRRSRWVGYIATPDPSVPNAAPLLKALRQALIDRSEPDDGVIRTLTAFTHPRRLAILAYLHRQPAPSCDALAAATEISPPALYRHLTKLASRGLVTSGHGKVRLVTTRNPLARSLLALLAQNDADGPQPINLEPAIRTKREKGLERRRS